MTPPFGAGRLAALTVGLVLGLVATAVCLACWAWQRRHHPGAPSPVAGLALAAASAVGIALTATTRPPGTLPPGLVLLAVAGFALRRARVAGRVVPGRGRAAAAALLLAGATLAAWSLAAEQGALFGVWVAAAICAAGALLDDFDRRRHGQGLTLPLLAVSAAGIYTTVPDVETAVVVVGVAVPMALLGWPGPLAWSRLAQPPPSLGTAGALATAGLLVWTVAAGGSGRPGSIVGGLACLGVLAVEPVTHRIHRSRDPLSRGGWVACGMLAAQVALVGVAARMVGRPTSPRRALALAALELGAILAASVALDRLRANRDRSPPDGDEIASG